MNILIIKLGADGDVIRTLPIAKAIKDKYPDARITWVTKGDIADLLQNTEYLAKIVRLPFKSEEVFDILYNFDIDNEAIGLANEVHAKKKIGFYSSEGYPAASNLGAEYYLNTVFDDELKKSNKKTYQEMMLQAAELPNNRERFKINLTEKDIKYAEEFKKSNKIPEGKILGIHMGSSSRWPSKVWDESQMIEFIKKAGRNYEIIIFGGPNEIERHKILCSNLRKDGIKIFQNNPLNSKREFASLLNICDAVVCSDSFSLHVSIGLGKKTICLFFCTSPNEVEGYGLLTKIVSPMLYEFFPERSDEYSRELTSSISSDDVMKVLNNNK